MGLTPDQHSYRAPESIRILNFREGAPPIADSLENAARTIQYDPDVLVPAGFISARDAASVALHFETNLKRVFDSKYSRLILGTHLDSVRAEDGVEVHMPFVRLQPLSSHFEAFVEQFAGAHFGENRSERVNLEGHSTGRILVDYRGFPAAAIFTGPNAFFYGRPPGVCWYLSSEGNVSLA